MPVICNTLQYFKNKHEHDKCFCSVKNIKKSQKCLNFVRQEVKDQQDWNIFPRYESTPNDAYHIPCAPWKVIWKFFYAHTPTIHHSKTWFLQVDYFLHFANKNRMIIYIYLMIVTIQTSHCKYCNITTSIFCFLSIFNHKET